MSSFFSNRKSAAIHLNSRLVFLAGLLLLLATGSRIYAQETNGTPAPPADTLTAQVAEWDRLTLNKPTAEEEVRQVLKGATHDLSMLNIDAVIIHSGHSITMGLLSADVLVIVKEGSLTVTNDNNSTVLGPGGIALFAAGEKPRVMNAGSAPVTIYVFNFKSRAPENRERARQAGPPFLIDWKEMMMKKTDKGESRQIFNRPVAWLGKIDMHATTLNAGEVSHPPHVHRVEEIILLRSGNVQEYIGGKYYKATAGDLIFLPSGVPHALENKSNERCEYFALQWML